MLKLAFFLALTAFGYSTLTLSELTSLGETHSINKLPDVTMEPVFGILTQPLAYTLDSKFPDLNNQTQYIGSSYVKYLEMSGARVVPISLNSTYKEIDILLSQVNGVFFTGGDYPFWVNSSQTPELTPEYAAIGCYIYEQVKRFNELNNFFPLWGTCLGFELIHVCANNQFGTIGNFNGEPAYTAVHHFTRAARSSAIFTYLSPRYGKEMMKIFSTKKVSLLGHRLGISPETYKKYDKLRDMFEILSTMQDLSGSEFIGVIEGKDYPIFGIQFHPEKNSFEFLKPIYPHDTDAVVTATYLSNFIVSLARKNSNVFPSVELNKQIIYNYPPVYTGIVYETVNLIV